MFAKQGRVLSRVSRTAPTMQWNTRAFASGASLNQDVAAIDNTGDAVYNSVQNYYGKVLATSDDLKTTACTTSGAPPSKVREALKKIPQEIKDKYYGCGTPLPAGIEGLTVLDLGSGSGQDCYLAANFVGPNGKVIGVDMTDEQLEVARRNIPEYMETLGYPAPNLEFKKGYIEFLGKAGVPAGTVDLVISNCVINLSPNKEAVLQGVYDTLKDGGELYFSDVYASRRLSEEIRTHDVLLGECIGGALYTEDFKRICQKVGFMDPRQVAISEIVVTDPELLELCGEAKFYSITYRCFKNKMMETLCEDYGQVATYKGTLPGKSSSYELDDHHLFETGKPMLVCGNTALMVGSSWLAPHFEVVGDMSKHYGLFDCAPPVVSGSPGAPATEKSAGGCC